MLACNSRCSLLCRYDLKDTTRVVLQDTHFLCAMAPPGGGRNVVSPRFLRHFIVIGITPFNDDTMTRIFGTLLSRYLRVSARTTPVFRGFGGLDPWKYVGGVRVCFDPLKLSHSFIQNCCCITLQVTSSTIVLKMDGKTTFSRRLKQFDGLTRLTLTPWSNSDKIGQGINFCQFYADVYCRESRWKFFTKLAPASMRQTRHFSLFHLRDG